MFWDRITLSFYHSMKTILLTDIIHGLRMLRRAPVFTTVAILSIALGVGANTAIFRVVDQLLLRELPVQRPAELVTIQRVDSTGVSTRHSTQLFDFLTERSQTLASITASGLGIWEPEKALASGENHLVAFVAGNFFQSLGLKPSAGRLISPSDDKLATDGPVVVLDYEFWQQKFQGDPKVVGTLMRVNREPLMIAGVAPQGFFGIEVSNRPQIYIPMRLQPRIQKGKDYITNSKKWVMHWLAVVGRPKPGLSATQAQLELSSLLAGFNKERSGGDLNENIETISLASGARGISDLREKYSRPLQFLMASVALILLIACVNVANLLLERASARRKEISIRLALGASRWRICRQLLTEGLLIGLPGGALGLLFSDWGSKGLSAWVGFPLKETVDMRLDWRILAFTLTLSILTTVLFSLAPLFTAARQDIQASIKDQGASGPSSSSGRLAKALVVLETSLALVLLVGAGLFFSSLQNLRHLPTGFRSDGVLQVQINPSWGASENKPTVKYEKLERELSALPGVEAVGFSTRGFLQFSSSKLPGIRTRDFQPRKPEDAVVDFAAVTNGYFSASGLPLLAGRTFNPNDAKRDEFTIAVINQTMARRFWTKGNPVGDYVSFGPESENVRSLIVGVVGDAKYNELREDLQPMLYFPHRKDGWPLGFGLIKSKGNLADLTEPVRRIVQAEGTDLFLSSEKLTWQVEQSLQREQLLASLSGLFGMIALALASMGIYGVIAYSVTRRTAEMGLRIALGAMPGQVIWMMLRESLLLAFGGVLVGLPAAYLLVEMVKSLLFGVDRSTNVLHMAGAALVLLLTAMLAGIAPALRASRVSPLAALRCD